METTATHDPITGLLNHRAVYQHLNDELAASNRRHERLISVIFADLDHFKQVNDTWGHQIGDSVLKHVAGILTANVSDSDTVGRYGGEEFIIVLPEQDQADALLVAERVRMMIAQSPLNLSDGHHIALTFSLGVATFPHDGNTLEAIVSAADAAMYDAKHQGRNCVCQASISPQLRAA